MDIIALITLYNPDEKIAERVETLSKQVSKVILLDNSPNAHCERLFSLAENVIYHFFGKNLGLSMTFNWALKNLDFIKHSDYVLFFDQDSCVTENLVHILVSDFEKLSRSYKVGCMGPVYFDSTKKEISGINKRCVKIDKNIYKTSEIITSSMLTTYDVLEKIGFWDETIFLDYSDFELCWRMKKYGFETFISRRTVLNHSLGVGVLKCHLVFKEMTFNYSTPLREYYQTRAAIKLLKRDYVPSNWRRNFVFNITIRILFYIFYLPHKLTRLKYFYLGFLHGILSKNGEIKISK